MWVFKFFEIKKNKINTSNDVIAVAAKIALLPLHLVYYVLKFALHARGFGIEATNDAVGRVDEEEFAILAELNGFDGTSSWYPNCLDYLIGCECLD